MRSVLGLPNLTVTFMLSKPKNTLAHPFKQGNNILKDLGIEIFNEGYGIVVSVENLIRLLTQQPYQKPAETKREK